MREKKFRAWDKQLGKMVFFTGIFNQQPYEETSTFPQYESVPKYHHLIVMDYTGLKDKNGKEIYEGDRVHYWNGLGEHFNGIVQWNDGCFDVVKDSHGYPVRDYLKVHVVNHAIEVIGNIYEEEKGEETP